jgi:hypothetical protein
VLIPASINTGSTTARQIGSIEAEAGILRAGRRTPTGASRIGADDGTARSTCRYEISDPMTGRHEELQNRKPPEETEAIEVEI